MKALYYPSTQITSERILKNGLLLWDSIETIVPYRGFQNNLNSFDNTFKEAYELIVEHRVPNKEEQLIAHKSIRDFVGNVKEYYSPIFHITSNHKYLIYPEKLLDSTWNLLEENGLAHWDGHSRDYATEGFIGLLVMSFLADACAGLQLTKITDSIGAYSWLEEHKSECIGGLLTKGFDASQVGPAYDRLVSISLNVLDANNLSLRDLIEFRKRELKIGGTDYRSFRIRYQEYLNSYINRIRTQVRTKNDIKEIEHQFMLDIKDDMKDLQKELRFEKLKTIFSKEIAISIIAFAGALIEPISGITTLATTLKTIGVAPLIKVGVEYRQARRKILRSHTTSILYLPRWYF